MTSDVPQAFAALLNLLPLVLYLSFIYSFTFNKHSFEFIDLYIYIFILGFILFHLYMCISGFFTSLVTWSLRQILLSTFFYFSFYPIYSKYYLPQVFQVSNLALIRFYQCINNFQLSSSFLFPSCSTFYLE